ncbi:MAG: DUF6089 family protein [Flammeovirgaceae bacterium]
MHIWLKGVGSLLLALIIFETSHAQIVGTYKRLEVGFGIGTTYYTGDVAPTPNVFNTRYGGEAFIRYNFNPAFAIRGNIGAYLIAGDDNHRDSDPFYRARSHSFGAFTGDASVLLEYNFFNFRGSQPYPTFSPYIVAGVGRFQFRTNYENSGISPGDRSQNKATGGSLVIPFGVGIKFPLTKKFNIACEFRANKTFTDYLDMLGDGEVDNFSSNQRFAHGNVEGKDMYYYWGISLAYRFVTLKCPKDYPARTYDYR